MLLFNYWDRRRVSKAVGTMADGSDTQYRWLRIQHFRRGNTGRCQLFRRGQGYAWTGCNGILQTIK